MFCSPGTASDAKTYPADNVVDLFSWTEPVPMRLWCLDCMPVAEALRHKTSGGPMTMNEVQDLLNALFADTQVALEALSKGDLGAVRAALTALANDIAEHLDSDDD